MTTDEARTRVHRHPIRVYFEDTDASGAAYHASYIRWAERARTEALRAMGMPHQQMLERGNAMLVVRRIEVEYWRPARLDAALVVETSVHRVTGAALDLVQVIRHAAEPMPGGAPAAEAGEAVARLVVGLVCVGLGSLRPAPLPEPWRSALKGLVSAAPAGAGTALKGRARATRRDAG